MVINFFHDLIAIRYPLKRKCMSIATGGKLTSESFDDFITRLKHHCVGAGVAEHCTADAIFRVEAKRYIYGIDPDYTEQLAIIRDDQYWRTIDQFLLDCPEELDELNKKTNEMFRDIDSFNDLLENEKYDVIAALDDTTITGWDEQWEHVNSHFTKEAADAFVKRKSHDYRDGMRVYVDAQLYCWEWNKIKEALISGQLVWKPLE